MNDLRRCLVAAEFVPALQCSPNETGSCFCSRRIFSTPSYISHSLVDEGANRGGLRYCARTFSSGFRKLSWRSRNTAIAAGQSDAEDRHPYATRHGIPPPASLPCGNQGI